MQGPDASGFASQWNIGFIRNVLVNLEIIPCHMSNIRNRPTLCRVVLRVIFSSRYRLALCRMILRNGHVAMLTLRVWSPPPPAGRAPSHYLLPA